MMSQDQDMIPTKESPGYQPMELDLTVDSDAVLLQQRMLVAKLSRDEIEDRYKTTWIWKNLRKKYFNIFSIKYFNRYLRLLEESTLLKKHACKQEEKIKKLATKLIRVISEKKRMEVASGGPGKVRDIETEELIEDQQQRIRELDQENKGLKEKLLVAKNQLMGSNVRNNGKFLMLILYHVLQIDFIGIVGVVILIFTPPQTTKVKNYIIN